MIDILAGKNSVKIQSLSFQEEMEELRLKMYPLKVEGEEEGVGDEELGYWEKGEDGAEKEWIWYEDEGGYYDEEGVWIEEEYEDEGGYYDEQGEWVEDEPVPGVVEVEVAEEAVVGEAGQEVEWQQLQDEEGNWYYLNPVTGESQWA